MTNAIARIYRGTVVPTVIAVIDGGDRRATLIGSASNGGDRRATLIRSASNGGDRRATLIRSASNGRDRRATIFARAGPSGWTFCDVRVAAEEGGRVVLLLKPQQPLLIGTEE